MRIAVSGLTGFVGSHLKLFLEAQGNEVVSLTRADFAQASLSRLVEKMKGCDAVINLAGAPISVRWNRKNKLVIFKSRIDTTRSLVGILNKMKPFPKVFISTSAIGFYSSIGIHSEADGADENGFLAKVCQEWEAEAQKVRSEIRLVILRFGMIMGNDGGLLPRMVAPMQKGVSVIFGSGKQAFSWIHIDDLMNVFDLALHDPQMSGVFNCVAPEPTDMRTFLAEIDRFYHPFFHVKVPAWLLRLVLSEGSSLLTSGQAVIPGRLSEKGFLYQYPTPDRALNHLIGNRKE